MFGFWKKKPALGIGLGVGVLGVLALAFRYGMRRQNREPIPDTISPAIFATRVAQTSHGEMLYHTSGAGRPLLFIHGIFLGASSYEWSKVYPHFAIGHEVIAPDLIGFGESQRPSPALAPEDYADSLAEFAREVCGGRPPIVVASGLGAGFALLAAQRHPEIFARLIVLLPTGLKEFGLRRLPLGIGILIRWTGLGRFVYRGSLARKAFIRTWLQRFGFRRPEDVGDEVVDVLATCAQQYGAEHAMMSFLRGDLAFDLLECLPHIQQEVAILWPSAAEGFPASLAERMVERLPRGHLVPLEGMGVLAPLESPEAVTEILATEIDGDLRFTGAA